jgi:hypothetical protein
LENNIYIVKFNSALDPNNVHGTLIIDNTAKKGINLSTLWRYLIILGGIIAIITALLYFIPLVLRHINEVKVYQENERIRQEKMGIKNPVVSAKSGSGKKVKGLAKLKKNLHDFKSKWKGTYDAEKQKEKEAEELLKKEQAESETGENGEEKPKDSGHSRFTDAIREKRERREFARQQGLSEEDLQQMESDVASLKQAKIDSFAHLRGETPIIIVKEKETAPSDQDISANAVAQGGAVFSSLESAQAGAQAGEAPPKFVMPPQAGAGGQPAETPPAEKFLMPPKPATPPASPPATPPSGG